MGKDAFIKATGIFILMIAFSVFIFQSGTHAATEEEIQQAIEDGVAWLVLQQDSQSGCWENSAARTGFAVVKLEELGHEIAKVDPDVDGPFDPDYIYSQNVIDGLDCLFTKAANDTCGNHFAEGIYDTYATGIAMMAIAAGGDLTRTVSGGVFDTETYEEVLEANVAYLANFQNDSGTREGAWYYNCEWANSGGDNSITGYAVLGLSYAEAVGITIPAAIKTHLNVFIDYIQNDQGAADDAGMPDPDGGSGYTAPTYWVNSLKTGNLLSEMAFFGDGAATQRVIDAIEYISSHWYDTTLVTGWGYDATPTDSVAQYQAAYTLMKGLDYMGIDDGDIPGVTDWFQDLADVIVAQQNVDGSWSSSPAYVWPDGSYGTMSGQLLSTVWALLTLERVAPPPPIIEVPFDIKPGSCPNPINVKSKGVLPAAIMGTESFDVTTIDPASLRLRLKGTEDEGVAPLRWAYADLGEPFEPYIGKEDCYEDCVDCSCADGNMDLVFHFDTQEVVAALGEVNDEYCLVLEINGALKEEYNGTPIVGEDVVRMLVKGKQK